MTWQEVVAYLGGLIAALTTASAFVFQYLRRDTNAARRIESDIVKMQKDLEILKEQIDEVKLIIARAEERSSATDDKLETKMEKIITLFIQSLRKAP